jgi:hypothetical protein
MDGSGLKLVGCDVDTDRDVGFEPPAPIPFKQYAARLPSVNRRQRSHIELEGHPLPFVLPTCGQVDEVFELISRRIDELAKHLGLVDEHSDDTDRPRAA